MPIRFTTLRETVMSHESIPLLLYGLGIALLLAVAWADWAEPAYPQRDQAAGSRSRHGNPL